LRIGLSSDVSKELKMDIEPELRSGWFKTFYIWAADTLFTVQLDISLLALVIS
jgi:hypothetical protein